MSREQAMKADEVEEITMDDRGIWLVHTLGSIHRINLDRRLAERIPGPGSTVFHAGEQRLRTLERCRVGESARFTYFADDYLTDYLWATTSTIQRIVREEAGLTGDGTAAT